MGTQKYQLAGSKLPDVVLAYLQFNIPPHKTDRFGCGNVKYEKTIELS